MDVDLCLKHLISASQQLKQDLGSIQGLADSSGFTTVMGAGVKNAGKYTQLEMQELIAGDEELTAAGIDMTGEHREAADRAIRRMMTEYGARVAQAGYDAQFSEWNTRMESPVHRMTGEIIELVKIIDLNIKDIEDKVKGLQKMDAKAETSNRIILEYEANVKFVCETSVKLNMYDTNIGQFTVEIDRLMCAKDVDSAKTQQEARASMISERRFVESMLMTHFDKGSNASKGAVKVVLKDLKIPDALEKGKGVELIQNVNAFLKNRAPQFYAVMSDVLRILAESKMGNFFKPATAANGYSDVKLEIRSAYKQQSQSLYDELVMKVQKSIMNDIRVSFKYGIDEKQACCEVGDGPMAIFCLLALFRPAGLSYRDSLRTKLEEGSQSFKGGSNPTAKIKDLRSVILEAMDLGVRIAWRTTGKGIVTVMSERGNNFAQILSKYNAAGGIVDPEDCIVELNRMFTDIEETIVTMEEGGLNMKSVMAIKVLSANVGTDSKKAGTNDKKCWFGMDCTRDNCTFTHDKTPKEHGEKKGKGSDRKGKGGDRKGKGGDRKGKGGKGESTCKAKSCTAPAKGWPLCQTCRREGLEKGFVTGKDGAKVPVTATVKADSTQKRLAQIEKQLSANQVDAVDDDSEDGDDLELFVGNKAPKSVQIAAAEKVLKRLKESSKRKRVCTAHVFDRLGRGNSENPVKTRRSSEEELNDELEILGEDSN